MPNSPQWPELQPKTRNGFTFTEYLSEPFLNEFLSHSLESLQQAATTIAAIKPIFLGILQKSLPSRSEDFSLPFVNGRSDGERRKEKTCTSCRSEVLQEVKMCQSESKTKCDSGCVEAR